MGAILVDNKAGILADEKSVLEVFSDHINRAIENNEELSFHIAVGFFFFEGFQKLHTLLKNLHEKGLLKEFKLVMGPETKKGTKEVLEALKNDALILNDETFEFIKELYKEDVFDFRIFLERGFHIKLYLFDFARSGLEIWAGSANLTGGGLEENLELVVPTGITIEDKDLFKKFFKEIWKASTDEVENLKVIDIVGEASLSEVIYLHPREFIINLIKMLGKEYLVKNISADLSYLAEFQNMSYYLCFDKLKSYGGAVLANSVGLGKTDVGCMVARYYKELGKNVLIIYPPVIEKHWRRTIEKVGLKEDDIELLSRGMLHKGDFDYEKYQGIGLVIVDEAHHFRISKPKSNRRENLENIIRMNPNANVLLITATPINTSLSDFVELLKLFTFGNYKAKFESEGFLTKMKEIERAVKENEIDKEVIKELNDLTKFFSVRIDWLDVIKHFTKDIEKISGRRIESPEMISPVVNPCNYRYDEEIATTIFDEVVSFLAKLNFEYTKLWEEEYAEDKNLIWWYKWRLYKRLESSIYAFEASLAKMLKRAEFVVSMLTGGEIKKTKLFPRDRIEAIFNCFGKLDAKTKERVVVNLESDIEEISSMLKSIEKIRPLLEKDEKIEELVKIMRKESRPALIFSESRDTVVYIRKKLKEAGFTNFKLAYGGSIEEELEDFFGEEIKEENKEKIEREFNAGKFDFIISTDILSEGVDLDRADVVINFDLPYNPVRLIQRSGRAIRIRNPKKITIYNFLPDDRINKELELCERLEARVELILASIGLDFVIWSIEEAKIEEFSEENRKRIVSLIGDYRNLLATKTPDEIKKRIPPTLSEEDKVLREYIKYWSISDETVEYLARSYQKPIFTALEKKSNENYFAVFEYRGSKYLLSKLAFSERKIETRLGRGEMDKIESMVSEKCLELDREFLKESYGKDRLTRQIEKMLAENEELKEIFKDFDFSLLPKKDKHEILKELMQFNKLPPWRREEAIEKLETILAKKVKSRGYQRSVAQPKLLAVIKYDGV